MLPDNAVVITGLGAVSPNGVGVTAFARAMREGKTGLKPPKFEHEHVHTAAVASVDDFDVTSVMPHGDCRRLPRLIPLALAAAREAMQMAGLGPFAGGDGPIELSAADLAMSRRIGLMLGSGGGGIDFTIDQFLAYAKGKSPSLWTITNATHGNLAGELSIRLGLRGPSHCISTGCSSSSDAFGTAMLHLQMDRCGAMVAGGADAHLCPGTLWPMELLQVISTGRWSPPERASRPFDKDRDGFILGEGAWFAVLERWDHAQRRGATPLALLAGYGCTCDAYHRVRPDPNPLEAVRAIDIAIQQARMSQRDVEYVQYHGTSTPLNDATETRTIRQAFGRHAEELAGSSLKSMIGHPQGACGAASLVGTIAALRGMDNGHGNGNGNGNGNVKGNGGEDGGGIAGPATGNHTSSPQAGGFMPPTINLDTPDPECDLDFVPNVSRPTEAKVALVNCLAFGAKNSAIVLRIL